jgi:hypothetical protein
MSDQLEQHILKELEYGREERKEILGKIHEMKVDVAVLKAQRIPAPDRRVRIRDTATGSGIGAVIVGVIMAVVEYFKKA